jgi:hypothetical protein
VSVLSAPESQSRVTQRRRERPLTCAQPGQAVPESRTNGLPAGDRLTLGQVLDCVWEGLSAGGSAECPICHARMTRSAGASAARCERCGTSVH